MQKETITVREMLGRFYEKDWAFRGDKVTAICDYDESTKEFYDKHSDCVRVHLKSGRKLMLPLNETVEA